MLSISVLGIKDNNDKLMCIDNLNPDYIHLDIMDGIFVPNKTFNYDDIKNILGKEKKLDVHLMVNNVIEYINEYKNLNPEYITIHYENENIDDLINEIKNNNIKVGISLKPNTPVEKIFTLLDKIDLVLIMSVEPGFGGQKFINSSLDKIKKLKKYIVNNNYDVLISVDGGINNETSKLVIDAGVDIIVSGSFITNSDDYNKKIDELLNI